MVTCLGYLNGLRAAVKLYKGPNYVYYYDHRNQETFAHDYGKIDEEMGKCEFFQYRYTISE